MVSINDICNTTQGVQISKNLQSDEKKHGYERYLYISDLVHDKNLKYVKNSYPNKKLTNNDLVMANTGSPGSVFKGKEGILSNNLFRIRFDDEIVDRDYLYNILSSSIFQIALQKQMKGGVQKHLGHKTIGKQIIPLPPLEIQKRIAQILDDAAALRDKTKELLKEYDLLAQSIFLDMFGDPTKGNTTRLGDTVEILGGYAFKSSDFVEVGIPLVKIGTINKGYFDLKNSSFLPVKYLEKYKKWIVKPGDLLMSLTGTVGKNDYGNIEVATNEYDQYLLNQRVAKLIANKEYNTSFFYYMFLQAPVKRLLTKNSRGVRQANISNNDIIKLKLIKPKIVLQNQFAKKIALIEQQKTLAKQELQESEDLFNCLLQKAFKGELV